LSDYVVAASCVSPQFALSKGRRAARPYSILSHRGSSTTIDKRRDFVVSLVEFAKRPDRL